MLGNQNHIQENVKKTQDKISYYARKYQRPTPQLLAVSKRQSVNKIRLAYESGIRIFGENYLQDALEKIKCLPEIDNWHFIGKVQSNKIKQIAKNFQWVHTLVSIEHAKKLNLYAEMYKKIICVCIQINIDNDQNKSGVLLEHDSLLKLIHLVSKQCTYLKLRGLMCILAKSGNCNNYYRSFCKLSNIKDRLIRTCHIKLDTLSMGMSEDLEAAVAAGSTLVRVGKAIFEESSLT